MGVRAEPQPAAKGLYQRILGATSGDPKTCGFCLAYCRVHTPQPVMERKRKRGGEGKPAPVDGICHHHPILARLPPSPAPFRQCWPNQMKTESSDHTWGAEGEWGPRALQ